MHSKKTTLQDKLQQQGVLYSVYLRWRQKLLAIGYTKIQVKKLTQRENAQEIVEFILRNHTELVNIFQNYKSTLKTETILTYIARIANNVTGVDNLVAFVNKVKQLSMFTLDAMVEIAAHEKGGDNLLAVAEHFDKLILIGFTQEQIKNIASANSGAQKIRMVAAYSQVFLNKGFTHQDISDIADKKNGENLLVVIAEILSNINMDISKQNILSLIGSQSTFEKITCIQAHYLPCKLIGFTLDEFITAMNQCYGLYHITQFSTDIAYLQKQDFSKKVIVDIVRNFDGLIQLPTVTRFIASLKEFGLDNTDIMKISQKKYIGSHSEDVICALHKIKKQGAGDEVVKILILKAGSFRNLSFVTTQYHTLKALRLQDSDIINILNEKSPWKNLNFIINNANNIALMQKEKILEKPLVYSLNGRLTLARQIRHWQQRECPQNLLTKQRPDELIDAATLTLSDLGFLFDDESTLPEIYRPATTISQIGVLADTDKNTRKRPASEALGENPHVVQKYAKV